MKRVCVCVCVCVWGGGGSKMVCEWSICTLHVKLVYTTNHASSGAWTNEMAVRHGQKGQRGWTFTQCHYIHRSYWKPYSHYIMIWPHGEQACTAKACTAKPDNKDTTCTSYFKPLNPPSPQTSTTSALSSHINVSSWCCYQCYCSTACSLHTKQHFHALFTVTTALLITYTFLS
jgi:hypothetical protein